MGSDVESPESKHRSSSEVPWESVPTLTGSNVSNLRASLKAMATMCKEKALMHGKAAERHALQNNVLQLTSILVTSGATICAVVSLSDGSWSGQLVVAILSSSASATQGVLRLLNPDGKKEKHLSSEHRYTCLARDIIIKLVSGNHAEDYWEDIIKDCQRTLDNIEALAPDL